jgi:demethylmenaquinone methyltransferase/2-methoxy-6-polyprenyl-1,4-benzoquinol methylase
MPFRETFDCLWCGRSCGARDPGALEGWAQLCPECLGRAQDNGFLRERLRHALAERGAFVRDAGAGIGTGGGTAGATREKALTAAGGATVAAADQARGRVATGASTGADAGPSPPTGDGWPALEAETRMYYAAQAAEYDDFYLRRGRYARGPVHDLAWQADLEAATDWLAGLPLSGRIVELAAGTGWWSPLLARKGELWMFDANPGLLDVARDRLVAHGLRAHLHVRDAWEEPDAPTDALFAGFWLSHVPRARIDGFLALAGRWLRPGGRLAFIDSRRDAFPGAADGEPPSGEIAVRRLGDGRAFRVVQVTYDPGELEDALWRAGFSDVAVTSTSRFFLLGTAVSAPAGRTALRE